MDDLRDTISDNKGWLEAIADKIPLYKGYKEKELRREADALLREHLAGQLAEQLGQAETVARQMLTGPGMSQLDDMGLINTRLQTLIDKVKTAAQGYAGLFDAVKVKEEALDNLYEFDHGMLSQADNIAAAVEAIQAALDGGDSSALAATVRRYGTAVSEALTLFKRRNEVILGLTS